MPCVRPARHGHLTSDELAKLDKGMERHKVYLDDVVFTARELHYDGRACTAYLTKRHRIAIYHDDARQLYQFDTFADLTAPRSGWSETGDVETAALIAAVADALGEEHVTAGHRLMRYVDAKVLREMAEGNGCTRATDTGRCLGHAAPGVPFCLGCLSRPEIAAWLEGIRSAAFRAGQDGMRSVPPGQRGVRGSGRRPPPPADMPVYDYLINGDPGKRRGAA